MRPRRRFKLGIRWIERRDRASRVLFPAPVLLLRLHRTSFRLIIFCAVFSDAGFGVFLVVSCILSSLISSVLEPL